MPQQPLPDSIDEFLTKPNPAVIGTLDPDGKPHTAATWYLWEDGRAQVNMAASRKRLDYLRHDPRISLTVMAADDWYRQVTLRGRVISFEDDMEFEGIDRLSQHYRNEPYANREEPRVHAVIEVESWYGWVHGRPWRPQDD